MRLFRLGRMINRLLILGILVGAVLLIFMWKADESFLNKVREKIGIPTVSVPSTEYQVPSTDVNEQDEENE